jgi:1,4-dihydroxy-6-naphthoate synthase
VRRISVGISTCPNDTFAFHALLTGDRRVDGVELDFFLADVEELNRRAAGEGDASGSGRPDLVKLSYAAALDLADHYRMLPTGSALGFGVGPVILGRSGRGELPAAEEGARILCPGEHTTATLLWRLFHADLGRPDQVPFHAIMPALSTGQADYGVCIHEGRFTWADHGLELVSDLGATWERTTGAPLPLGGIAVRKDLPLELQRRLAAAVRDSIADARRAPEATLPTMRRHAQEHADQVLWKHVELYVNDWTADLGVQGRAAVAALEQRARAAGLSTSDARLEVLD